MLEHCFSKIYFQFQFFSLGLRGKTMDLYADLYAEYTALVCRLLGLVDTFNL